MSCTAELDKNIETVRRALSSIRDMFESPATLAFDDVHVQMEKLEAILNAKAFIDAAFAHLCERDGAGRLVGAKHPNAYLKQRLGLSPKEAYDRLARGKDLFGEPDLPEPGSDSAGAAPDSVAAEDGAVAETNAEDSAADAAREAAVLAAHERAKEDARRDQQQARHEASRVSADKQDAIRRELDNLLNAARGARPRLHAEAMREARNRDVKDLRAVVRRWVEHENRKHRQPANPNAGMEKRSVRLGQRKADGTYDIHITATAGDTALFKALMDKGAAPNSNLPEGTEDYRSPSQRHYDQFIHVLKRFDATEQKKANGCASVVISVTLDEIADADATTRFATNTGIELDSFDLVRLGMDGTADFVLTIDGASSVPLNLWRSNRTASIAQRVALLAIQGVCAWTGCSTPLTECEAHHILAWIKGGTTDIANLTALCREHHRCNNDHRDHRHNTHHMEYDPGTGRAGLKRSDREHLEFNTSDAAYHSAVNRLRRRRTPPPPPPEPVRTPRAPGHSAATATASPTPTTSATPPISATPTTPATHRGWAAQATLFAAPPGQSPDPPF